MPKEKISLHSNNRPLSNEKYRGRFSKFLANIAGRYSIQYATKNAQTAAQ